MGEVEVPDEFSEWPHEARRFVLAEANTVADIRREIDGLVGLDSTGWKNNSDPGGFTKAELAAVLMALGGPEDADVAE